MPRWTIAHMRRLVLAGVAGISMTAILSIAAPAFAQARSGCCSTTAAQTNAAAPPSVHDHAVRGAGAAIVDADIARLLARMDETTGDERMAVMTDLITLLVQDRAARLAPAATSGTPMCAMCAEHAAGNGETCAMCAEHRAAAGGSMCAMCAAHQSAGNGQPCAMCARDAGTGDHAAGAAASPSCCADHK